MNDSGFFFFYIPVVFAVSAYLGVGKFMSRQIEHFLKAARMEAPFGSVRWRKFEEHISRYRHRMNLYQVLATFAGGLLGLVVVEIYQHVDKFLSPH